MNERKFGALSSSVNPNELSASVSGVIQTLGALAVFFGYGFLSGDINSLADQVGGLVSLGVAFWGAANTAFGLLRKILVAFTAKG